MTVSSKLHPQPTELTKGKKLFSILCSISLSKVRETLHTVLETSLRGDAKTETGMSPTRRLVLSLELHRLPWLWTVVGIRNFLKYRGELIPMYRLYSMLGA